MVRLLQIASPLLRSGPLESVIRGSGFKYFAYCSDTGKSESAHCTASEKELRRRQRPLSAASSSHRRHNVRAQVARLHRKIANTRNSWLHKGIGAGRQASPISSS